jgi:prevent-host-death family protein
MSGISAAEANRNFSRVLREVRDGRSYVITSHGRPVATIAPFSAGSDLKLAARRTLLHRLRTQSGSRPIGRWRRDELYRR